MANKFRLTKRAVEDLGDIWDYTYDNWSASQADKYYSLLLAHFQEIASGRVSGKRYTEVIENLFGSIAGQHIIFYTKINETTIEIVRILHSRMDIQNQLSD